LARRQAADPRRRIPSHRFGVIYLGETLKLCFLEAVLIDSNYALDGVSHRRDNGSMTDKGVAASHKLQMLVLERRDASVNIARFYVLAIEPTLFGDTAVVREWGRIGFLGCRRLDLYPDTAAAAEALDV
jgi:predicted DNA-binding WGR domain protein